MNHVQFWKWAIFDRADGRQEYFSGFPRENHTQKEKKKKSLGIKSKLLPTACKALRELALPLPIFPALAPLRLLQFVKYVNPETPPTLTPGPLHHLCLLPGMLFPSHLPAHSLAPFRTRSRSTVRCNFTGHQKHTLTHIHTQTDPFIPTQVESQAI